MLSSQIIMSNPQILESMALAGWNISDIKTTAQTTTVYNNNVTCAFELSNESANSVRIKVLSQPESMLIDGDVLVSSMQACYNYLMQKVLYVYNNYDPFVQQFENF